MSSWFSSKTYHIDKPFRTPAMRGALVFFVFVLALSAVLQWVGQSPLSETLPPPSLDFRNPEFNTKMNYLDALMRQEGKVDCLIIGSSQVNVGLDPLVIDRVYAQATGYEIHCMNFGLSTLTTDTAAALVDMLVKKYHPRLLIFEISARSFDKDFGDLARPLIENPWIRYVAGDPSLQGWALDNFYLYRYYATFKLWQHPYSRNVMLENWQDISRLGFSPDYGQKPPQAGDGQVMSLEFRFERPNWQGFQQVLGVNGKTQLIVMESPVQESYLPFYIQGGLEAYQTEFVQPIRAELSAHNIPFWSAQVDIAHDIPEAMWYDTRHLNAEGAVVFSTWLAQKMAQQIPAGVFR